MTTIERGRVLDALRDAGLKPSAIYDDYSGRFMYGAKCFGIVVPSQSDVSMFLVKLSIAGHEEDAEALAEALATDDMGKDIIAYFPGYTVTAPDVDVAQLIRDGVVCATCADEGETACKCYDDLETS